MYEFMLEKCGKLIKIVYFQKRSIIGKGNLHFASVSRGAICRVPSFCVLPPAFSAEKLSPPGKTTQLLVVEHMPCTSDELLPRSKKS